MLIAAPQRLGNAGIEFRYRSSSGEGTTVPDMIYYAPALPGIDDPNQLERCEAAVRAYIAIGSVAGDQF